MPAGSISDDTYRVIDTYMISSGAVKVKKNRDFYGISNNIKILKLGDEDIYKKTIYDMGDVIQIAKSKLGNFGAPGQPRKKKKKKTPDEVRKQNERNRWRKVQRIILANFKEGDWHLILKYRTGERPDTYKEAKAHRKEFLDKMRAVFRKQGIPFKWIIVTERGKKGQVLHHHLVIEDIHRDGINTVKLVKKLWTYGNEFFVSLYEEGEYEKLAQYIVKAETKEECGWCTYSRSRNLVIPEKKVEIVKHRRWRNPPIAPRGWYVVQDSIWNGENPVTGQPVQHYTLKRLKPFRKEDEGDG